MADAQTDPEFDALQAVLAAITPLDTDAASRVLRYVSQRCNVPLIPRAMAPNIIDVGTIGVPHSVEHHHHYPPMRIGVPDNNATGAPLPERTRIVG